MVMVMTGGEIHQRIVMLDEPVSQEQLSQTADRLTNMYQGKDAESIRPYQINCRVWIKILPAG
jgi:heat-inducible transcriptional repressor